MSSPTTDRSADAAALEGLVDAAARILAADSLNEVLGRMAEHLRELVRFDDLAVYELDASGRTMTPVFAVGLWVEEVMADTIDVQEGVTGWVVRNRRTRRVDDSRREPLVVTVPDTDDDAEAFVSTPMLAGDRVVGALNVYRVGVDEPFTRAEVALVERFTTMAALAYDSARQRERLRHEARTDGLTGVLNHRAFQERLRDEVVGATGPLSVVALDLDHFKAVNDLHGHGEGDRVLRAVAGALRPVLREADVLGRIGGEEFAVVLPGADAARAGVVADRLRAAVASVTVRGRHLRCSAGIASWPADTGDAVRLLELADAALYAAKRDGRDRAVRFHSELPLPGLAADRVRDLLEGDLVRIVTQPILDLRTDAVAGYEALARMPGDRGPQAWFADARACGLGPELEARAVRTALQLGGRPPDTWLSVNISPAALLTGAVRDVLPADLREVVVELTEHEVLLADPRLTGALAELRAAGARIALDDAGAGYAGLQAMVRLRPDILKLDRSLVDGVDADPVRLSLLDALVAHVRDTGATLLAEGVERTEELEALRARGVGLAQGYVIARPGTCWPTP